MSFDIARTSTLEAVASDDEQFLAADLQKRVDDAVQQAEAQAEVAEAARAHEAAAANLAGLRKAERVLNEHAKRLREEVSEISQAALEAIVAAAASSKRMETVSVKETIVKEAQLRLANRGIERVVEHLIPVARLSALRSEAHALEARARSIERNAQERAEKLLVQLRDAVTEEVVLPVDLSKGVVGAMLARAAGLKRCAVQISEEADAIERNTAR
jgi:hypothetical protein